MKTVLDCGLENNLLLAVLSSPGVERRLDVLSKSGRSIGGIFFFLNFFIPNLHFRNEENGTRGCDFVCVKLHIPQSQKRTQAPLILVQRLYYFTDVLPNFSTVIMGNFYLNCYLFLGAH